MNIGTVITLLILLAVVGFIIFKLLRDKKSGVSSCSCGKCPNSSVCHRKGKNRE